MYSFINNRDKNNIIHNPYEARSAYLSFKKSKRYFTETSQAYEIGGLLNASGESRGFKITKIWVK